MSSLLASAAIAKGVTPVLAHYGGIDEIGIFVIPAVIAIVALRRVEKKAREREAEASREEFS